jgi:hypothetical protein
VVQQYEYSTGLSRGLCRMFEHLHCQAHGIRGHIVQQDGTVIEFTIEKGRCANILCTAETVLQCF